MAITTDSYIDVISGGITYDRIGLSKTLNNYTFNDLYENAYCGQYDISRLNNHLSENDVSFTSGNNLWNYSVTYNNNKWSEGGDVSNYSDPDGLYGKVIWLQCNSTFDNSVTVSNFNKYKLVTEWDAPKYCADAPSLNAGPCSGSLVPPNWNTDKPFPAIYYAPGDIVLAYRSHLTFPDDVSIEISGIRPYMICKFNNVGFIYKFDMNEGMHYFYGANAYYGSPDLFAVGGITSFDTTYSLAEAMSCDYMSPQNSGYDFSGYPNDSVFPLTLPLGSTGTTNKGMISSDQRYIVKLTTGGTYVGMYAGVEFRSYFTRRHDALMFFANMGIKFYAGPAGKHYKPIIENGIVIDFSEDLEEPSELDNWTGTTAHDVPDAPTPPTPPPSDDDDIDSMGFDGMSCSVGGPAKYYIMSYSDIHHLIGDFNAHAEPGTSISNNIISCYVNALDWNWSTGSETIEIYSGGAQTTAFTSDIKYAVLTGYNARDIIGSIDVPRMTNTFYDFSPYSTYEVYIPFCGWVALPDTVAGRHIKIYFETDEATCGCKGRVFFVDNSGNGVTVAEITGSFGAPCPIQVIEGGLYKQAMLSNGLQVIGGMASGIMGGAMGAGALAVSGLSSAMQSLGNCLIAGNTNYGQTIGRAGDASGLMCAGKPYLKITYPPIDGVVNNSRFGHTVGYLCNTIGQLSSFSGFTVCANPHITGINCTDSEKEELKRLLEEGVIL